MSELIGYARVSSTSQNLDAQSHDSLTRPSTRNCAETGKAQCGTEIITGKY